LHLDHLMHRHLHEARDFAGMVMQAPDPSAALSCRPCVPSSACTGLHISAGLLWLGTMMAQVFVEGFRPDILRRLVCFNLFWHSGSRPERRTFKPRLAPSSLRRQ
jgi:cytochrome o ubiquinol oxidase subunit III